MALAGQAAAVTVDARKEERENEGDRAEEKLRWKKPRERDEEGPKRVSVAATAIGDEPSCSLAAGGIVVTALAQFCIVTVAVWLLLRFPTITGAAGEPPWLLPRKRNECGVSFPVLQTDSMTCLLMADFAEN
ncbi:hypothetical protein Ahy_A07g034501 isoform B [Arachis hypogaea]|uniref:Uncharacterized protein n=1 Tax=Arachis hypogaea TaxID=3818 RepID=A0A445CC08_ARAHY|nr:hypothetical protein Ahy_A07g034501 isoform B [Arachis hypogaea]